MRQGTSFMCVVLTIMLCLFLGIDVTAAPGSGSDLSKWDVTSYKVDLRTQRGGSGDIQIDQNGWIHLGANHLEGGDVQYQVLTGNLRQADILEVWIDGFSTSNNLNIGPTVFIGAGKNRFEQITRISGDAWRPFVFRFADDAMYGDVTDPSNRNENWRIRYPSSQYEVRRIDKAPQDILSQGMLPIRISITGAEDFIIKRIEVVVYRTQQGQGGRGGVYIVNLTPSSVRCGDMVTLQLNQALPTESIDFYVSDANGREYKIAPRIVNQEQNKIGFSIEGTPFSRSGQYQVKLVDRSETGNEYTDTEHFQVTVPQPKSVVKIAPAYPQNELPFLPPAPESPTGYIMPTIAANPVFLPPPPQIAPVPMPVGYGRYYTIQIGAFRVQSAAVSIMNNLRRYGFDAYISEMPQGYERVYRVRVGKYPDKSLALRDASRLRNTGFDTWITDAT